MNAKPGNRIALALLGAAAALALFAAPAAGGELDDLKAQLEKLKKRIEQLEARQEQKKAQEKKEAASLVPGFWTPPKSNTSLSLSGYVKLDMIYDFDADLGDEFVVFDYRGHPSAIPLDGADTRQKASMHARQTRIRLDSITPTKLGELKTRVETDFYGGGNALRLRHAYASLGPVIAGQTWSIFQDEDVAADTVDFAGPAGVASARLAQLRYTWSGAGGIVGQIAVEDPDAPAIATADGTVSSSDRAPNLLAAVRWRPSWGAVNVSGVLGEAHYDQGGTEDSLLISALHVGAKLQLLDTTTLMATLNFGKGALGTYMFGGAAAATLGADGNLDAVDSMGGLLGLTHRWSGATSSGIYYGWVKNDFEEVAEETFMAQNSEHLQTLHVNFWWDPEPKVRTGLEFMHGWRETHSGEKGEASRIQLGLQYSF